MLAEVHCYPVSKLHQRVRERPISCGVTSFQQCKRILSGDAGCGFIDDARGSPVSDEAEGWKISVASVGNWVTFRVQLRANGSVQTVSGPLRVFLASMGV